MLHRPEPTCSEKLASSSRVKLGNLAFDTTEDDIRRLFHQISPYDDLVLRYKIEDLRFYRTRVNIRKYANSSCPTSHAYLDFATPTEAQTAFQQVKGTYLRGSKLRFQIVVEDEEDPQEPELRTEVAHFCSPEVQFAVSKGDREESAVERAHLKDWWWREKGLWLDL